MKIWSISDLARHFGVTSRTLRFYEEVGLLASLKDGSSYNRRYDDGMVKRLELILGLKQLGLTIAEIGQALHAREDAIHIVQAKIDAYGKNAARLREARENLKALLTRLKAGAALDEALYEVIEMGGTATSQVKETEEMRTLADHEVRLITLNPMRVACCRVVSEHPENESIETLLKWVRQEGIDKAPHTRYFGYDTSHPTADTPAYGYEFCVTVEEDIVSPAPFTVRTISGGLYAVYSYTGNIIGGEDIPGAWKLLMNWVKASPYEAERQRLCLEEHFENDKTKLAQEIFQLDLWEPIKKKG